MSDTSNCVKVKSNSNGRIKISLKDLLYILTIVASFALNTGIVNTKLGQIQKSLSYLKEQIEEVEDKQETQHLNAEKRISRIECELDILVGP